MKKTGYLILAIIGGIGLLSVLTAACLKSYISQGDWFILILSAAVSMVLIGCGVRGFDTIILSERYPRTPAGRARFVREALSDKESILRRIGDWFREIYWKHLS